jgi:RNA 2',3'-cyclic 3'-phosphodiesterase
MLGGRYFVGLALPPFLRETLGDLRGSFRGLHFVPPENYHLTLKFLGGLGSGPAAELRALLAAQVQSPPFLLELGGVGRFPDAPLPPRVLWAGLVRPPPQLFHLQEKVERTCLAAGIEPSRRSFRPHVTLANVAPDAGNAAEEWLKQQRGFASAPFRVEAFYLFRRCPETRRYLPEATLPLEVS